MNWWILLQGFSLGATMIIPIGAQNAYVLNQGIKRHHHLTTAATCGVLDMIFITLGIFGGGALISQNTSLLIGVTLAGILFCVVMGFFLCVLRSNRPKHLNPRQIRWLQDVKRSFWCLCGHCV